MDALLHALSDEHRRTIVRALRDGPRTAGALAVLLPIARPGASRHLRVLREAGLVDVTARAQEREYRLSTAPLEQLDTWLDDYRALWDRRIDALHTEIARGRKQTREDENRKDRDEQHDERHRIPG